MMRTCFLVLCVCSLSWAAEPLTSGVAVGKRPGPYSFLVATGPQRGQQTCYICEQAKKPAVVVFARTPNDSLAQLLRKLDAQMLAQPQSGFKAWATFLAATADLDGLATWSQKQSLKNVPVGVYEDADGPPAYRIHRDAEVTVLVFVDEKVQANFAFRKEELTEAALGDVMAATQKLFKK